MGSVVVQRSVQTSEEGKTFDELISRIFNWFGLRLRGHDDRHIILPLDLIHITTVAVDDRLFSKVSFRLAKSFLCYQHCTNGRINLISLLTRWKPSDWTRTIRFHSGIMISDTNPSLQKYYHLHIQISSKGNRGDSGEYTYHCISISNLNAMIIERH